MNKRDRITTIKATVEDALHQVVQLQMNMDRTKFAKIFYTKEQRKNEGYIDEKWGSFQRNGWVYAFAHLDGRNVGRVCRWLAQKVDEDIQSR